MSVLLHPAGPEPPAVYWRRRAIVIGGFIVLIILLVMIVKAATGGDDPKVKDSKSPSALPTLSAQEGAPSVPEVPDCVKTALTVDLNANDQAFSGSDRPTFTATVTNTGGTACVVDPSAVIVHITSGSDRIFDSGDCEGDANADAGDSLVYDDEDPSVEVTADNLVGTASTAVPARPGELVLLQPAAVDSVPVSWNRQRSNETCDSGLPDPQPGTYHATVTVNGAESTDAVFELR